MGTLGGVSFFVCFREMLGYCELPVIFLEAEVLKKNQQKTQQIFGSHEGFDTPLYQPLLVCSSKPRDILLTSLWLWHLHGHVSGSCWYSFYSLHHFCSHRSLPVPSMWVEMGKARDLFQDGNGCGKKNNTER